MFKKIIKYIVMVVGAFAILISGGVYFMEKVRLPFSHHKGLFDETVQDSKEMYQLNLPKSECPYVSKRDLRLTFPQIALSSLDMYIYIHDNAPNGKTGDRIIYKGAFKKNLIVKDVEVCLEEKNSLVRLAFAFVDQDKQEAFGAGSEFGYHFFNGKKNTITFIGYHDPDTGKGYLVEQEE